MELIAKNTLPTEELLRNYSGRRLQFAIKMGLLPTPENYRQLLKMQNSKSIRNAHPNKYWKERSEFEMRCSLVSNYGNFKAANNKLKQTGEYVS